MVSMPSLVLPNKVKHTKGIRVKHLEKSKNSKKTILTILENTLQGKGKFIFNFTPLPPYQRKRRRTITNSHIQCPIK